MSKIISPNIAINSVDFEIPVNGNNFLSLSLTDPDSGTQEGGTMTFEGLVPGSANFEALSPNTINIATPLTLKIENQVLEKVRVTVTGFTGTATNIKLSLNDWGEIRK